MKKIAYKNAGVDIDKADKLISDAKKIIATTRGKGSMGSVGGFSGFFDPSCFGVKQPVLAAATDGVGTKLKIAQLAGKHDTIGIDLVAMCVNDLICSGARPLFFLDYFSTGKLENRIWKEVIKGIVKGCRQAGCTLLGGETAEMPGMYPAGEYDLAGFAVGLADRKRIIDGKRIKPGDVLLGIASSGLHSNGYSLVRRLFPKKELVKQQKLLLKPTTVYVKPFLDLAGKVNVKGAAHITGGGLYGNVPRILPKNVRAVIRKTSWKVPRVFRLIAERSGIPDRELYRTFNMGIGMVLVLGRKDAAKALNVLKRKFKIESWIIGEAVRGRRKADIK